MSTTDVGRRAETVVANYLQEQGFQILQKNWRTRYCEIDIVAQRADTIYFVEVKYRLTSRQGAGLDYITPQKLRRMAFAAELWVVKYTWQGKYSLVGAEVTGAQFEVTGLTALTL